MIKCDNDEIVLNGTGVEVLKDWYKITDALAEQMAKQTGNYKNDFLKSMFETYLKTAEEN